MFIVDTSSENRRAHDFYPTPPLATYCLLDSLGDRVPKRILEPCAGRGHISAELARWGHEVISYDLFEHEDALVPINTGFDAMSLPVDPTLSGVITNPPFYKGLPGKLTEKFVSEYDFVAMFVRITFLESVARRDLFLNYPPTDLIFFSDRVNFDYVHDLDEITVREQIGGMVSYIWWVRDKNAAHSETRCHWASMSEASESWLENTVSYSTLYGDEPAPLKRRTGLRMMLE